jgi:hypothetical protein
LSAKRQILMLLDKTIGRRVILTPAALLATTIGIVASPLIVVVTVSRDLILRRTRVPTLRLAALVVGALVIETVGMAVSFITWTFTGFGKLGSERWRWHLHRAYMGWYTRAMLTLITRVLSTEVTWRDHADLSSGPVVMVARHTSFFDAVIPATVLSQRNQLLAHHIVSTLSAIASQIGSSSARLAKAVPNSARFATLVAFSMTGQPPSSFPRARSALLSVSSGLFAVLVVANPTWPPGPVNLPMCCHRALTAPSRYYRVRQLPI